MVQGILIIIAFVIVAALMMTKKIPTLLALPLLAVVICIIAGVPMFGTSVDASTGKTVEIGWLTSVFEAGTVRMASAIMAVIFGAWLGQLMNKTGVTETIIKKSAELGGDKPLIITLIMAVIVALLFTTLSGLGSIIMVGSIVLPVLISVGVPAASAAGIFLMSFTTGLALNPANWKTFSTLFSMDISQIQSFEVWIACVTAVATILMIVIEFKRNGIKFAFSAPVAPEQGKGADDSQQLHGWRLLAMLTPIIPIVLVAFFKVPVTPAFTVGIIWILIFTSHGFQKAMNTLAKTCYDGITDVAPAIIIMIGIGILYLAVTNSTVKEVLNPFLLAVTPTNKLVYILFFSILAPLALYRGPLNMFGLGSGIAALIIGLNTLNPQAVMGAFLSAERIQCGADPTNTQNVWTANFCEVDVNALTKKMLPYLWGTAVVGVVLSAVMYM
ncbi:MAG: C4-dicarboxylate ABC transporter [Coriobacteriales bacterium]|jgi:TRAP-type C4-dicarboxylate transport system permease large subunit